MKAFRACALVVVWAAASLCLAQQAKGPAKGTATASGVFVGRSGKPMVKARIFMGEIAGDQEVLYAKVKLPTTLPSATTDEQGRFQLKGFPPGEYTLVYLPAGAPPVMPAEINIKAFLAVTKSIAPLLRNFELGKNEPYPERPWGREFTLLKGHTFMSEGPTMKIWNATVRRGQNGPYMEIRRGLIWLQRFEDGSQIRFEAWSF
jgi:hypothetical protein